MNQIPPTSDIVENEAFTGIAEEFATFTTSHSNNITSPESDVIGLGENRRDLTISVDDNEALAKNEDGSSQQRIHEVDLNDDRRTIPIEKAFVDGPAL